MRALITGITGQDGSYLAEHLLALGYDVFGLVRRVSSPSLGRLDAVAGRVRLIEGDVLDQGSLWRAIEESAPDEIYHLAGQSFVGRSWREPVHTFEVTGLGTIRMLEATRAVAPKARFYQASSSEMYGNADGPRPDGRPAVLGVDGPFRPRSPYAVAKLAAHHAARNYRESFGMFVACGITFNHESPRRGPEFVTRKIAIGAARAAKGGREPLPLGNLAARRDWGWAPDYVVAFHALLRLDEPIDVVLATGTSHSVEDVARIAYDEVGLDWREHVVVDPNLARPAEVHALVGDPTEAERRLHWRPTVGFEEMIRRMVRAEMGS